MAGVRESRPKIVLAAAEAAGVQVLRRLVAAGHDVVLVLAGRERGVPGATVAGVAETLGFAVRPVSALAEPAFADDLRRTGTDLLLNVHAMRVAHPAVLAAPRLGAFNLHPGPLPERAGLHAPLWAVLEGADRHAVTLHRMEAEVDAGAIAYREDFAVAPTDTGLSVMTTCVRRGVPLVLRLVETAARGEAIPARPQDPALGHRWHRPGPPDGGRLAWDRPARALVAFVRACDWGPLPSPWGHPAWWLGDRRVEVLRASETGEPATPPPGRLRARAGGAVDVAAADEWVRVERIALDGRPVPPSALSAYQRPRFARRPQEARR